MKLLAKLVFGTLGCVLLISAIVIITPRAMYAAVARITRNQDNPARHPFTTGCTATPSNAFFSACDTPAIPAGQEVVIETISFNGNGDPGNIVLVPAVTTTAAGVQRLYFLNQLPDTTLGQPARAEYEGAQSLRLYAGPGTIIVCNGFTHNLNPTMGVSVGCTISGYFVALP